jgi:hypothetical protein
MLAGGGIAASEQEAPSHAVIRVWTYNYARADQQTISRAQREASRIFARIGVVLEWVDCPPSIAERDLFPRCREFGIESLVLRVFTGKPQPELARSRHVFGLAYLDGEGKGSLADVYTGAAELLVAASPSGSPLQSPVLLGHLMAHELGHLLLASNAHSRQGIMRSPWSKDDLRLAISGGLRFDDEQGERIGANLHTRLLAAGLSGPKDAVEKVD